MTITVSGVDEPTAWERALADERAARGEIARIISEVVDTQKCGKWTDEDELRSELARISRKTGLIDLLLDGVANQINSYAYRVARKERQISQVFKSDCTHKHPEVFSRSFRWVGRDHLHVDADGGEHIFPIPPFVVPTIAVSTYEADDGMLIQFARNRDHREDLEMGAYSMRPVFPRGVGVQSRLNSPRSICFWGNK